MQTATDYDFYPFTHPGLILRDRDCAVLKCGSMNPHLCGYAVFRQEDIPREWHGNYNTDALQWLSIHGGITFCEVEGGDAKRRQAQCKKVHDEFTIPNGSFDERGKAYMARRNAVHGEKLTVPYTHVVFGFDCAHLDDEQDTNLSNPEYVMKLAKQMKSQLLAYAARIDEWRAANREQRIDIIQQIVDQARIPIGKPGFLQMISMLRGGSEFGSE